MFSGFALQGMYIVAGMIELSKRGANCHPDDALDLTDAQRAEARELRREVNAREVSK